jgi:hypothetical protein
VVERGSVKTMKKEKNFELDSLENCLIIRSCPYFLEGKN